MARQCIFCGGGGLTNEHAWPQWILNEQNPFGIVVESDGEHVRTLVGPKAAIKLKVVCAACNNGWMSDLEAKAKPVLGPLIDGQRSRLGLPEQALLNICLTKTAMVFGFMADEGIRFYTREDCAHLRVKGAPPGSAQEILIGHYCGTKRALYSPVHGLHGDGPHSGFQAYVFTMLAGHFVGQVLAMRNEPEGNSFLADVSARSDATIAIRRPCGPAVDWPPRISFDDDANSIEAFAIRGEAGIVS